MGRRGGGEGTDKGRVRDGRGERQTEIAERESGTYAANRGERLHAAC